MGLLEVNVSDSALVSRARQGGRRQAALSGRTQAGDRDREGAFKVPPSEAESLGSLGRRVPLA